MVSAMDTPPEGKLAIDVDTLIGALSHLNVEAKLPRSIPKSSHSKRRRELRSNELFLLSLALQVMSLDGVMEQNQ